MKIRLNAVLAAMVLSLGTVSVVAVTMPVAVAADEAKAGWYGQLVDVNFVAKHAVLPKPDGVQIIDSRPAARKFDPGHIPTAMNIPDSQFEKMVDRLPKDKSTLLIFYCDGVDCMLSHKSAVRAEQLGYTNIRVYAEGYPDWIAHGHMRAVSVPYLKKLMDEGAPITVIDSRPKERKYDKGHIPGAISIPDLQFDKLLDRLPADKASALYFYCEGLSCKLSSSSADKAVAAGYTNVSVVPEGYPEWVSLYGAGPTADAPASAAAPALEAGKEKGTLSAASFEKVLKEAPSSIHLIDVRDPEEFATGSFKGAINIPINSLEARIDQLPDDKPLVFFCGAGGRSGEAYDMVMLYRPKLKAHFLDMGIKWGKDGTYTIADK